jgi:hypothetical protein
MRGRLPAPRQQAVEHVEGSLRRSLSAQIAVSTTAATKTRTTTAIKATS